MHKRGYKTTSWKCTISAKMEPQKKWLLRHSMYQLKHRNMWPNKGEEGTAKFYCTYFLMIVLASPLWVGLLLHLIVVTKDHMKISVSVDISVLSSMAGMHFMVIMYVWGQEKIAHLYNLLTDFERFGKPDDFDESTRRWNLYSTLYAVYCNTGAVIYIILKHVEIPECRKYNEKMGYREICGLFVPFWTPYDLDYFPVNKLLIIIQGFSVYMFINGGAAMSFTTFEVAMAIVLQIRHLKKKVREVFDDPCDEVRRKQLVHCIKYHHHIIRLQEMFDDRYKYCNGSYVLMIGIIIAGLANQYMKEKNPGALIHLGGWIFSFFICCHAGQMILSESTAIPNEALKSKWHEAPVSLQKDLLLLIAYSQNALELHASPIGVMSYELYITLVKTSTSYFALLNRST